MDFAVEVIDQFRPNVIIGIPSLLINLAQYCREKGLRPRLEKVYYGGEMMTEGSMALLRSLWGCQIIRSAGYASTEVGAIAWQCLHCEPGEHFPFADNILEIVDGEIVVTSLTRTAMPIVRYRTGDRGEWAEPRCACGGGAPLFRLRGRHDMAMIVWGCWLRYEDIIKAFEALHLDFLAVQVHVSSEGGEQVVTVRFESTAERIEPNTAERIRSEIYERSLDLNATVARDVLSRLMRVESVPVGTLRRNERTGKVIPIIDTRS
jgi:phenylacetate-coenzyme A ligase PaaK-like adenylate-forming protein